MPAFTGTEDGDWLFRVEKKLYSLTENVFSSFEENLLIKETKAKNWETLGLLMNFDTITLQG